MGINTGMVFWTIEPRDAGHQYIFVGNQKWFAWRWQDLSHKTNRMLKRCFLFLFLLTNACFAQIAPSDSTEINNERLDSIYISETENVKGKDKVLHAEPLFIDLIRDLGARKGEREWNVGVGITERRKYDSYSALVEYEFAPVDRLGLEVELPFSFNMPLGSSAKSSVIPANKLNALKLAGQYSFFVNEKYKVSAAIGYIHEFAQTSFSGYREGKIFSGNVYNPFFVAAKRWGNNFHTLLYTGPVIEKYFSESGAHVLWQLNSNFHYMITGTRNFIGIEFNKELSAHDFDMTVRPQMRVGLSDNLLVGVVTGVPISRESQRLSMFLRIIYEPKHAH